MAAFKNTTILSRRSALVGLATAAAAAVPVAQAASNLPNSDDLDADFFALCKRWYEAKANLDRVYDDISSKTDAILHPAVPKELYDPLELPKKGMVHPADAEPWSENTLEGIVRTGKSSVGEREEKGDTFTIRLIQMPVSKATRIHAKKLLAIRRQYDAGHRAWWKATTRAENLSTGPSNLVSGLMWRAMEYPVRTMAGLIAKVDLLVAANVSEREKEGEALECVTRDIKSIAMT